VRAKRKCWLSAQIFCFEQAIAVIQSEYWQSPLRLMQAGTLRNVLSGGVALNWPHALIATHFTLLQKESLIDFDPY
jgi:hypothetical protein